MLRFLAFVWDPCNAQQSVDACALVQQVLARTRAWQRISGSPGLDVLCTHDHCGTDRPYALPDGSGAVVGTLFTHGDHSGAAPAHVPEIQAHASAKILGSHGRHLLSDFWGRYVAFLTDIPARRTWVLRDPVGDIACHCGQYRGVGIYFSDLGDYLQVSGQPLSVDWDELAFRAVTGGAHGDESALHEVSTLRPGECDEWQQGRAARLAYWNPFSIAAKDCVDNPIDTAEMLRRSVRQCVHAWAACVDDILHELSGGLDSSIVAACLRDAPTRPRVICVNLRTQDAASDERAQARLAARRAGFPLIERDRNPAVDLRQLLNAQPMVSPRNVVMQSLEVQPLLRDLARETGVRTLFSGRGGDSLFLRAHADLLLCDFMRDHGLRTDVLGFSVEAARRSGIAAWRLLGRAAKYGFLRRRHDVMAAYTGHRNLATDEVSRSVACSDALTRRWGSAMPDAPPAKAMHVLGMTWPSMFRDPLGRPGDPELVNPLTSQPVVELCLRIPTYILATGLQDRALARAAFAADLPPEVAYRSWKGSVDGHHREILTRNHAFAREILMDGALVEHRIIDRSRIEEALRRTGTCAATAVGEIFECVCVEAWLQTLPPAGRAPIGSPSQVAP